MKFYDIDRALQEAINAADKPVRLRIEIQAAGHFVTIPESDILEANFFGLKEEAGGTTARGDIIIRNEDLGIRNNKISAGTEVRVYFSLGEGLPFFQRFRLYVDEKGIQDLRGQGRIRLYRIGLVDLSYKLRKTDETRDWTSSAVFTYSVVCDKSRPEKSLVHGIAKRAGLAVSDIDCSTIPVTLPYVKLTKDIWSELSSLATAYRCHLECPVEKLLVFAHSPYQHEELGIRNEEYSYTFKGEDIFFLRKIERSELYRNTIRLKMNMPVSLDRQEIWRYDDSPVFYDEYLQAHYPFKYPLVRQIETNKYEAKYRIVDKNGKEKNVIYADQIDTKDEAENRLDYDGGPFSYSFFDVTTNHDKAIVTLLKKTDGDLYYASIHGRPIVYDLNRTCFVRDLEQVNTLGTVALNVTGAYFSDYIIYRDCLPITQYEDWVMRELEERLQKKREFTVKTHRALFHARVGSNIQLSINNEQLTGTITAFSLRYRKDKAFVAAFKIRE